MMPPLTVPEWLQLIAVIVGTPAAMYYPFLFLRVTWFNTRIGKSMLAKGIALAAVFINALMTLVAMINGWDWWVWVSTVIAWYLVFAVWYQVLTFRSVQREGLAEERSDDDVEATNG